MSDVFISYKRRLRPQVERIATALRELRIDVWFDAALEPGVSFSAEISNEVRNAGCVLVCFSDDAFPHGGDENGWVLGEASIGRKRGRLVTVMLDETEFDPPWNMIHTERLVGFDPADFSADRTAWRGALAAIGRLIERPGLADYDRALVSGSAEALKGWAQSNSGDVLAESVWAKVEEIELATVRKRLAEERVRPVEPVVAAPPKPVVPERVYAPLPEQLVESEQPRAQGQVARDIRGKLESEVPASPPPQTSAPRAPSAVPAASAAPPFSPPVAAAIGCAIAAIGAVLLALVLGDTSDGPLFIAITFGGPAAAMAILGAMLVISGYLKVWRAVVLSIVGYVGFFAAIFTAEFLTRSAPSFGTEGADIAGGFAMGAVGALVVLFTLVMLSRNPNLGRAIPISLSGVLVVGVVTALVMVFPGISLRNGNNVIWSTPAWHVAMGAVLVWLLAPDFARSTNGPVQTAATSLSVRAVLFAGLIGLVACSASNFVFINLGFGMIIALGTVAVGGAIFAAPLAFWIGRRGAWPRLNAILLAPAIGISALLVVIGWTSQNSYYYGEPETVVLAGLAGAAGAVLAGGSIAVLSGRGRLGRLWLVIGIVAVVEGLALATLVAMVPYMAHSQTGFLFMQILWQGVFVAALPFLLEPARLGGAPLATS